MTAFHALRRVGGGKSEHSKFVNNTHVLSQTDKESS